MPTLLKLAFAFFLVVGASCWESPIAYGQRRYQPARPTVSPYLNLNRFNNGALPNYYTYVRPAQEQQRLNEQQVEFNRREMQVRQQQAIELGRISQSLQQGVAPPSATGSGSWFQQPAASSQFMNTQSYYLRGTTPVSRR